MKLGLLFVTMFALGCSGGFDETSEETDDLGEELFAGVNGPKCAVSAYNCGPHNGGPRVETANGDDEWAIDPNGVHVRDGNGTALVVEKGSKLKFNWGQTRFLAGKTHFLAMSSSNGSAAWFPADHVVHEQSLRDKIGNADCKDPGMGKMACYAIRNAHDPNLEFKKVVYDSQSEHERAGDYLPLLRNNGQRSANLVFSVPGFSLGGSSTDHFPAGTKFQRVIVPTKTGKPSIDIPLWVKDGSGRYRKKAGAMKFIYGYIRASDGVKRFGWMAYDALEVSSGCK